MKKRLFVLLLFLLPCLGAWAVWDGTTATEYAGGDGTKDNPYLIANEAQFAKFANDVTTIEGFSRGRYFKLTADLVMHEGVGSNTSSSMNGGTLYSPQTPMVGVFTDETTYTAFEGIFDGDGHTISGLYSVDYAVCVSLFRVTYNAIIKNLGIIDSYFYGNARFAGIIGKMIDSKLINCYVYNTRLEGYGSYAGCLVGQCVGSSQIINCYASASLSAKNNAGGIVGRIGAGGTDSCVVDNCVSVVSITTTKSNKAGVSSENSDGSVVRNCFYVNTLSSALSSNKGTTQNLSRLAADVFTGDSIVGVLNVNAEKIPGACRWGKSSPVPALDYSTFTIDENEVNISALATSPIPADGDLHADGDSGSIVLQWCAPIDGKTISQYVYIGTDKNAIAAATPDKAVATIGADTCYTAMLASKTDKYYWRVDRVDAEGAVTKGNVWSFQPRLLAFPGAEGYGRFAHGGRGGKVVYVTNLNASGEGSFHHAITNGSGPRTVIFNVSGLITLNNDVSTDDYVTIAGQTAPGKGICIAHGSVGISNDNICRFLRSRRGGDADTGGSIGFHYSDHAIIDHATASWGTDETFSSRSCKNITIQRSMISEALGIAGHRKYPEGTNHGYAATIGGDIGSFHHNLLANCYGRNWSMGGGTDANGYYAGRLDIFNNVVYNWVTRTTDGGAHEVNFVNNYYKMGLDTKHTILFTINIEGNLKGTQSAYVSGNIRDNKNGTLSTDKLNDTYELSIDDGRGSIDWTAFVDTPYFPSYAKIETAKEAYKSVLSDVGANLPMCDDTDSRVIDETLNRSYTYVGSKSGIRGEIDNEADAGGYELYPEECRPADWDTDLDGLPNWWEEIKGTNTQSPAGDYSDSHADSDNDGFSALEDYLHFMACPNKILKPGDVATIDLQRLFVGYTSSPVYSVAGDASMVSVSGSMLTITAPATKGIYQAEMTVTDSEGATYSRTLSIAVTDREMLGIGETAIDEADIRSYEIYTLTGAIIDRGVCAENTSIYDLSINSAGMGIYLLKATDSHGISKSYKIVKEK